MRIIMYYGRLGVDVDQNFFLTQKSGVDVDQNFF